MRRDSELVLEAARQGMTLVKNDNKALPLSKHADLDIALVGPNADATVTMQSNYHGTAPYLISPAQGLLNYTRKVNLVPGLQTPGDKSTGACYLLRRALSSECAVHTAGRVQRRSWHCCCRRSGVKSGCDNCRSRHGALRTVAVFNDRV